MKPPSRTLSLPSAGTGDRQRTAPQDHGTVAPADIAVRFATGPHARRFGGDDPQGSDAARTAADALPRTRFGDPGQPLHSGASRQRQGENSVPTKKRAIGAYAARLVEPRDTILIASGTTTLAMAREIREVEELTAITTSLSVATTLAENDECTVIQLGGVLRNSSFSVVGPFAEQMLRQFSCSKLFFGVDGFDLNYGVTTTNLMGGHLALMMIETVQKVIALVDSSKFGRRGFCKMCDVDRIDMVITDDGVSPIVVEQLQEAGIDVRIVEVIRTTVP